MSVENKPVTITWDFDGTLVPNDPYDSEQTLMRYKLAEAGNRISTFTRAVARLMIYADQKEFFRVAFKHFYIWLFKKLQYAPNRGHWVLSRRPGNCLSSLGRIRAVASRYSLMVSVSCQQPIYLIKYSAAALRRPWRRVLAGLRIDAQWPALAPT